MRHNKDFVTGYLRVRVHTNSLSIFRLIDNMLDCYPQKASQQRIVVNFYLKESSSSNPKDEELVWMKHYEKSDISLSNQLASVIISLRKDTVKATIPGFSDTQKERIFDFIFMQPLKLLLAWHGLFSLHASAVSLNGSSLLITGAQNAGKSTLAIILAKSGFRILADDDCFLKSSRNQTVLLPFPTKLGLKEILVSKYPELSKHILADFQYGGKYRISMRAFSHYDDGKSRHICKVIIFPRYSLNKLLIIKPVTWKKAFIGVFKDSVFSLKGNKLNKSHFEENFWVKYNLVNNASCFELFYNDSHFDKIPGIISQVLAA